MATTTVPTDAPPGVAGAREAAAPQVSAVMALALIVPMLASGLLFPTYDIAMASLPLEVLRQLNAPFVMAEIAVCAWAFGRGLRLRDAFAALDRPARMALFIFGASFWIGGAIFSKAAPFATLFNLTYAVHIAFLASVAHLARRWGAADTAILGRLVFLGLAGFAIMIAVRFLLPPPLRAVETINWQFAVPGFISVRLFGAMAGAWCAYMMFQASSRASDPGSRGWPIAACALTAGMVVWSGTRAAVLGVGIAGLIALLVWRTEIEFGRAVKACVAALAGGALALTLLPYGDPDFRLFLAQDFSGGADGLASGRMALWQEAWQLWQEVPIFGAGPGATAWMLPGTMHRHIQPHNLILEFLLNWGAIAAVAALYLLIRIVTAAHRLARLAPSVVPLLLAADCLLVIAFVDGTFHFAQHLMLWAACTGIVVSKAGARHAPEKASSGTTGAPTVASAA